MSFHVTWTKRAVKELKALDKRQRILITQWVKDNLDGCDNPKLIANAKRFEGTDEGWRYRVGVYRILVRIVDDELVIEVIRVRHRKDAYKNLPRL